MNNVTKFLVIIGISSISCNSDIGSVEEWKSEILETEKRFADMAMNEGIPEAFLFYAAEEAVLERNNKIVNGKVAIRDFFDGQLPVSDDISLSWEPDFVDVSSSGDLGYTYGQYIFTSIDSAGNTSESRGVFHTVWKRQVDGDWKFVWD